MYNEALENIERDYFDWLYNIIDDTEYQYEDLINYIYDKDFDETTAVLMDRDRNRIEDAKQLREEFIAEQLYREDEDLIYMFRSRPCSLLEVLISLSDRMEDVMKIGRFPTWFWEILSNLGMEDFDNDHFNGKNLRKIDRIIKKFLDREYDYNGFGGLFPLKDPPKDQRKEEIWYQMSAYLVENYS